MKILSIIIGALIMLFVALVIHFVVLNAGTAKLLVDYNAFEWIMVGTWYLVCIAIGIRAGIYLS